SGDEVTSSPSTRRAAAGRGSRRRIERFLSTMDDDAALRPDLTSARRGMGQRAPELHHEMRYQGWPERAAGQVSHQSPPHAKWQRDAQHILTPIERRKVRARQITQPPEGGKGQRR